MPDYEGVECPACHDVRGRGDWRNDRVTEWLDGWMVNG